MRANPGFVMAVGVTAVAGASFFGSLRLPYYTEFGPDAGFFPYWVSLGLGGVGLALLIDALRNPPEPQPTAVLSARQGRAIVGFALYIAFLAVAGFAVATAVMLFLVVTLAERRRVWVAAVYSATTTASLVWLFQEMFRLPMPPGMVW